MKKVFQTLGVPANVYSDDGSEFKREFKMDFRDIEKQATRGHAYFAERTIRIIKEAMLRRIAAGAGRRGQWHLTLPDILNQINGRKHAVCSDGRPHAGAADRRAATAERWKRTRCPELGQPGQQRLVVLAAEVGGRWHAAATAFVRQLARVRARRAPPALGRVARAGWGRRW